MRFKVEELPQSVFPRGPQVGDVFPAKGGQSTSFWVLVAESITGQSGHYLGLDAQGKIVSTASYGHHAMRERALIGKVSIDEIELSIESVSP